MRNIFKIWRILLDIFMKLENDHCFSTCIKNLENKHLFSIILSTIFFIIIFLLKNNL